MSDQILTSQQNQVLALIATGSTVSAAAEAAGIHRNTIANWRQTQPGFAQEFHEAQFEQSMHWRDQMQSLGALAVDALRAVLADEKATPSTRLKAALVVLNCITKPAPAPKNEPEIAAQSCTTQPQPDENKRPLAYPAQTQQVQAHNPAQSEAAPTRAEDRERERAA
jgi:hypothetical protein